MTWGSTPCAASQRASQKPSCPASNATAMRVILWPFFSASARQRLNRFSNARSSIASFFNGWRSTPGTMPATSQLDWLISITAINVASVSSGSRHRLRSFTVSVFRFVMTGLHRYCRQCSDGYVPSLPPHSILTAASTMARWQYRSGRRPCDSGARLVTTAILADSRFPFPQSLQKSGNSNREVHRLSRFRNHQTACSCLLFANSPRCNRASEAEGIPSVARLASSRQPVTASCYRRLRNSASQLDLGTLFHRSQIPV